MANAVITVEERLKEILAARGVERSKIHVLMNLPDERIFAPRPKLHAKSVGDPFVLVYHGTLARRLGLDVALHAISRLKNDVPMLEFRIIGAGEERESLLQLRDHLGLQKQVSFSDGYVPVETIPMYLRDADVGVIPLRVSSGTDIMLPTKLLEYVSVGIPCIVPRTVTISRYFDDSMVRFFEADNPDSLATAVIDLYLNPELRRALSEQANLKFGRIYCWNEHKKLYTELVARLTETPSRSSRDERPMPK